MRTTIFLIITNLCFFCELSYSDVLIIDRINTIQNITIPARGTTMDQVTKQFGEPSQKNSAVGEPPITKWVYEKFSVYFEKSWVINSVIHKASESEKGPKSIEN